MDTLKITKYKNKQSLNLPKQFFFDEEEIVIRKFGDVTLLVPRSKLWEVFEKSLSEFSDDFMEERNQPKLEKRENLFE